MQFRYLTVILIGFVTATGCSNNEDALRNVNQTADSLQAVTRQYEATIDSLQQVLDAGNNANPWFNPKFDGRDFLQQDINDPESFIEQSLRDQPELIPLEPVLGGQMRFTDIQVLGGRWIIAEYEDGHIMGRSIYEYQLQPGGTVQFQVLASSRY